MAPSFFKILENPSAPHFILPLEFVRTYMGNKLPEDLVMLTANGGRSWVLKIEKIGQSYRFTNGWKQVVKDIPLGYWENLVFHLVDESAFNLTIYSRNGCELLLPLKKEPYEDEDEDDDDEDEDVYDEYANVVVVEDDAKEEKENDVVDGDIEKNEASVTETEAVKRKGGPPRKQPQISSERAREQPQISSERSREQPQTSSECPRYEDDDEDVYDEYANVVEDDAKEEKENDVADGDIEKNEASVTETEAVKRKRGRPRKQPQISSERAREQPQISSERPRDVVVEDDAEEEKENDVVDGDIENKEASVTETETVKRKRGRPRKPSQTSSVITVIEVKRKRGRPRKQPRVPIEFPTTELVNRLRG